MTFVVTDLAIGALSAARMPVLNDEIVIFTKRGVKRIILVGVRCLDPECVKE
jgi:hypothetical protein